MGLLNFVVPKYYLHGNKSYGIAHAYAYQAKENNITIVQVYGAVHSVKLY
jgi:hypothetical protein